MSSSRRSRFAQRWAPRLVSLSVLVGIVCSMAPLAVGQQSVKDLSEPFPCQHRACGCRSASQCWKRCCCFSTAQKLAWARINQVQPPDSVVAAARTEEPRQARKSSGCCHKGASGKQATAAPASDPTGQDSTIYVVAFLAHQCQGHHWYWNALPWTILPAISVMERTRQQAQSKLELTSEKRLILNQQPPVPPPR
jgi:hypothetical protein